MYVITKLVSNNTYYWTGSDWTGLIDNAKRLKNLKELEAEVTKNDIDFTSVKWVKK